MHKHLIALSLAVSASIFIFAAEPPPEFVEHISDRVEGGQGTPARLKNSSLTTKATFKPPVEIVIEAKTDSTNLRLGYAADQMIFNWEGDRASFAWTAVRPMASTSSGPA